VGWFLGEDQKCRCFFIEKFNFFILRALDGGFCQPPKDLEGLGVGRGFLDGRATSFF
jgi:hypothetical protein